MPAKAEDTTRVGFLVHYLDGADLRHFDPAFAELPDQDNSRFAERTQNILSPFVLDVVPLRSPRGPKLEVVVIVCPFTSDQALEGLRRGGAQPETEMVRLGMDIAIEKGCSVLGFGAYTSIVSGNCADLPEDRLACTSGNSLTVAAAVQTLVDNAEQMRLSRRVLGVVGASGNIGATLCELAAEHAEKLILIGRAGSTRRLERVAARIDKPVTISTDLEALRECDMIVAASNAPSPVIRPEHLSTRPMVICDVAVPADVHASVARERPLAKVLRGGLIQLPLDQGLGLGGVEPLPRHVYACMGETLLLGFEGVREHYSYGNLELSKVRELLSWSKRHDFKFASKVA
jgi:predicted amino acid dehydrogenase